MQPSKPSNRTAGRPKGSTDLSEPKTKMIGFRLTQTGYDWIKSKPKGWLINWIEVQARKPMA